MKKIAFLLAMIMLLGCGLVLVSCGDDDNSSTTEPSEKDKAIEDVEYEIKAEINKLCVFDGKDYTFQSFTQSSVSETGNGTFTIRGTVNVKNGSGRTLSASYTAIAEYDAEFDDYDVDLTIGTFR